MADTGRACARHLALMLKTKAAFCKSVPAIAVPDPDQLAMHQRPADQGHLPKARGAGGRCGADAVLCAGLSGGGFRGLRAERVRLWQDPGRCGRRGRQTRGAGREPRGRFRRPHLFARRRRAPRDGAGETATKPIVIADTQDNPGAGGDSDTTGMLRALVRNNAQRAATGVIYDPQSAKRRACRRRRRHGHAGARRQVRHFGRRALQGNLRRRKTVRRKVRRARPLLWRPRHGHGSVGLPAHRRRPRGRRLAQGAARGPVDVPLCRHRADRTENPGQQELGAFPRRFRADRRKASDLRRARRDAGRYRRPALDAAASGHPHQAERPCLHPSAQSRSTSPATG